MALLVAEVLNPDIDANATRRACAAFIEPAREAHLASPAQLVHWFRNEGFGLNGDVPAGLEHSNISWVLEHRQGIPISLAVLLITTARSCGLDGHGINYPGHFLVEISNTLIDPMKMQLIDREVTAERASLERASPRALGLRMLNNIKAQHMHARDWSRALDIIDFQMSLAGGEDAELSASLHYERGELWERLGSPGMARAAFLHCAETSAYRDLAAKARSRAEDLDGETRWH